MKEVANVLYTTLFKAWQDQQPLTLQDIGIDAVGVVTVHSLNDSITVLQGKDKIPTMKLHVSIGMDIDVEDADDQA